MSADLRRSFSKEVGTGETFSNEELELVGSVVDYGLFNEVDSRIISLAARKAWAASKLGAPTEELEELSEVLFMLPGAGVAEVAAASGALRTFKSSPVPASVYTEVINHALERSWRPVEIQGVSRGIVHAVELGLNPEKAALSMMIRVDQGLDGVSMERMVEEELSFIRSLEQPLTSSSPGDFESSAGSLPAGVAAFQGMGTAIEAGVPSQLAAEVAQAAIERHWSGEAIRAIFEGLIRARRLGLTLERLAVAFMIRMDQGLEGVPPRRMVEEEVEFVRGMEAEKLKRLHKFQKPIRDEVSYDVSRYDRAFPELRSGRRGLDAELASIRLEDARISLQREGEEEAVEETGIPDSTPPSAGPEAASKEAEVDAGPPPTTGEDEGKARSEKTLVDEGAEGAGTPEADQPEQRKVQVETDVDKAVEAPPPPRFVSAVPDDLVGQVYGEPAKDSAESFMVPPPSTPYRWGGNTRRGVDCSGFTKTIFQEQGILIPRVSRQQAEMGAPVDIDSLRFGDLVFFNKGGKGRITHVGMYYGNGKFAHATCSKGVTISRFFKNYYQTRFVCARRITRVVFVEP